MCLHFISSNSTNLFGISSASKLIKVITRICSHVHPVSQGGSSLNAFCNFRDVVNLSLYSFSEVSPLLRQYLDSVPPSGVFEGSCSIWFAVGTSSTENTSFSRLALELFVGGWNNLMRIAQFDSVWFNSHKVRIKLSRTLQPFLQIFMTLQKDLMTTWIETLK